MSENNSFISLGFCDCLFLVFLVLKLTHYIDWSWWWVTSPIWIPIAVIIGLFVTGLFIKLIIEVVEVISTWF